MSPAKKTASDVTKEMNDLLDRTMELDIRGLLYEMEEGAAGPPTTTEEPTVVLDLTATQVHDLLAKK